MKQAEWEKLSPEEKKRQLYLSRKQTLEAFLEQYNFDNTVLLNSDFPRHEKNK